MEDTRGPVERLEEVIEASKHLMGQISVLNNDIGKTAESVSSKASKAIAGINEASSKVPKDKVEVRHVWRVDPSTKQFLWSIILCGLVGMGIGWYVVKEGRDKSIENLRETIADQKERIKELEAQLVKPKPKAKNNKNK